MGYHDDPIINDLVLTIVNDGNGSQCGRDYRARCDAATTGLFQYRYMCREYNRQRVRSGSPTASRAQLLEAADLLQAYYREHVAECEVAR